MLALSAADPGNSLIFDANNVWFDYCLILVSVNHILVFHAEGGHFVNHATLFKSDRRSSACRPVSSAAALVLGLTMLAGGAANAALVVQYNPTGGQRSGAAVAASTLGAGAVSATSLSQTGFENFWNNTNVLPVGRISSSTSIVLGEYLSFSVVLGSTIDFTTLLYDKRSYLGGGPTAASIRSSLDAFAVDIDTLAVNPEGNQSLSFNLGSMAQTSGQVDFRLYFYAAPSNRSDWADLVSTAAGGNGLRLNGDQVVPEPATLALVGLGFVVAGVARRARPALG